MASSWHNPKRTHLNRVIRTLADPAALDNQLHADVVFDAARASLTARADALEAKAAEVGPRDPRYSKLIRDAELLRGSVAKVGNHA